MSSWFNFSPRSVDTYLRGEAGCVDDERRISTSTITSRQHGGWVGHKSDTSDVFYTPIASTTGSSAPRGREDSYRSWSSSLEAAVQERIQANRDSIRSGVSRLKSPNHDHQPSPSSSSSSIFEVQTYLTSRSIPPSMCGLSPSLISPRRVTKFQPIAGSTRRLANDSSAPNFSIEIDLKMPSSFRGSVSITTGERSSDSASVSSPASGSSASAGAAANLHHRRESFLYRSTPDSNDLPEASPKWHATNSARETTQNHSEDFVVTPFAQILQTLRRVRNNYMIIANLPSTCSRSRRLTPDRDDLSGIIRPSKAATFTEDQRRQLAIITLDDLEWSLEQLETIQIHKSVGDLATNKFRRLLSRELSQFAEATKAGSQISEYICNTFLDIPKDIDLPLLKSEDGAASPHHATPPVEDHRKQMSIISGVHTSNPDVTSCLDSEIPKYGVKTNEDGDIDELMDGINRWGVDVFRIKELTNSRPLTCITYTVLKERNLLSEFGIPETTLINYLTQLERHYRSDISYHNSLHAADVMQSSHYLVSVPALQDVFTSLEILAVIFGAAIHDVDHPGLTNQYLVNSNAELAIMYNDSSVLENHHLALAFKLLQSEGCDIFCNLSAKTRQSLRRMVIDVVLATDMSKHMSLLADLKTMVETKTLAGSDVIQLDNYNDRIMVLQNLVHCSDLSNPTKPLPLYRQWTDRIMEEFFRQGDLEKELGLDISPMCDRLTATVEKSQIGFIDYIVHPLWETWADLVFPDCQGILDTLEDNRQWYQSQIADAPPPDDAADAQKTEVDQLTPEAEEEVTLTVDAEVTSFPTVEFVPVTSDVFVEETLTLTTDKVHCFQTQADPEDTSREQRDRVSGLPLRCPLTSSRRTSRDLSVGGGGQSETR